MWFLTTLAFFGLAVFHRGASDCLHHSPESKQKPMCLPTGIPACPWEWMYWWSGGIRQDFQEHLIHFQKSNTNAASNHEKRIAL